jgi:geranylgeranyl reductase family protein
MYDCIIVGAGPAGSTTAYHLGQQGHRVLLLDQGPVVRPKPCSGALSPRVQECFDFDLTPAIDRTLRRIRYTWKLEDEVQGELTTKEPIWLVRREVFDPFLVAQAERVGVEVQAKTPVQGVQWQGAHWQVQTPDATLEARYVVGADGATGPMADWLGFPNIKVRSAAVLVLDTEIPDAALALNFEFGWVKNACIWGFPRQQGYVLGVVNFLGKGQDLEAALRTYAQGLGLDVSGGQVYTHAVKLWDGNRPLHGQQSLLVGEAGAIVDPLSAEGIRPAIFSGVAAAQALHQALQGDDGALAQYSQTIHADWGSDFQWAQRIAGVFYRVPGIAYRVGVKRPSMTERLGQLLAGEIRYGDVANRVIKRMSTGLIPGRR